MGSITKNTRKNEEIYSKAGNFAVQQIVKPEPIPFNEKPIPNSEITIQVCQGIGDIFWVYQKFAPYFDKINFAVSIIHDNEIETRSLDWLTCFPKVQKAFKHVVTPQEYESLFQTFSSMNDALEKWKTSDIVPYSCNRWLETGTRLEDIDPGSMIDWAVPMQTEVFDLPYVEYATVYVSGSTADVNLQKDPKLNLWSVQEWISYVKGVWKKHNWNLPVIVLGASFDKEVSKQVAQGLNSSGIKAYAMIQEKPERVLYCLGRSKFHVGYQSGLSMLADNLGVPQIMINFTYLKPMIYTWCQRGHTRSIFKADTFERKPETLIAKYTFSLKK